MCILLKAKSKIERFRGEIFFSIGIYKIHMSSVAVL